MALPMFGSIDLTNFYLNAEENPFFQEETNESFEGTVLHLATKLGHEELVKEIIKNHPSLVRSTNSKGDTPLHLAARLGHTSILLLMLDSVAQSTPLHEIEDSKEIVPNDLKLQELVNKNGLTPLHCAAINGSVETLTAFNNKAPSSLHSVTLEKGETVFHLAARNKKKEAFIFMAQSSNLNGLLYKLDAEGNTVLHAAASVGFLSLVIYIVHEIKMEVTSVNNKGFRAVDLLYKDDEDVKELSVILECNSKIVQRPSGLRDVSTPKTQTEMENSEIHHDQGLVNHEIKLEITTENNSGVEVIKNSNKDEDDLNMNMLSLSETIELPSGLKDIRTPETLSEVYSRINNGQGLGLRESRIKEKEMQSEALQNARNTISVVAVLIASVAFTCGMNPPGGVYQEGSSIGKATAGKTIAFKIFSISNSIALFTSICIVILMLSIIPFRARTLKKFLVITHKMIWVAVIAMASAYVAATWVTLPNSKGNIWVLNATLVIACVMLGGMFIILWFNLASHLRTKNRLRGAQTSRLATLDKAFREGYYSM